MTTQSLTAQRRAVWRSYRDQLSASTARTLGRRRFVSQVMIALTFVAAFVAVLPLLLILWHLVRQGAASVGWQFFTALPKPAGDPGGGMANATVATGIIVSIAALLVRAGGMMCGNALGVA